jgi:hypothetical protein
MMDGETAFEKDTRDRLERLERGLRRWRSVSIVALSLATVVAAVAMADPPAKELRVETLRIVEPNGRERIVLTAVPGVPDMTFFDPSGRARLTLDIADDNKPVLVISESSQAKGRLTLGIENGSPVLNLYDRDGARRVTLGIPHEIGGLIRIYDARGKFQARVP